MIRSNNKWVTYFILLLVYSLIYFFYSGSLPWNFAHQLPGNLNGDMSQFLWNAHHFGEWMNGRQDYFHTDLLFTPYGSSLQYHTYSHLMAATSHILGNAFLGINLVVWLHYILSGLGAYLLARFFKLNWSWAFLVGFIFAFIPYKFAHFTGHFNLQQTAVIPLFILIFFKTFPLNFKEGLFSKFKFPNFIILLLLSLVSILSSYIYSAFLLFFGIGYILYYTIFKLLPNKWIRFGLLIILTVIATKTVPYLLSSGIQDHGAFWWADDMGKFLTPNWNNAFYSKVTPFFYSHYGRLYLKHSDCFIGFALPLFFLIISSIFLFSKDKQFPYPVLGFFTLFFFMLSSPKIQVFLTEFGYFPTSLYHFIPIINNARIPDRFILMLALFLPILSFSIAQLLLNKKRVLGKILPFIFFAVLFIEFNQNHIDKAKKNDVPEWANQLRSLPKGNILPLPTGVNDGNAATGNFEPNHLYYQSIHGHKLIGGYISRITNELREVHLKDPVMASVLNLSIGKEQKDIFPTKKVDLFIEKFQVAYIVIPNNTEQYQSFVKNNFEHKISREIKTSNSSIYVLKK